MAPSPHVIRLEGKNIAVKKQMSMGRTGHFLALLPDQA
jgi:hypothetical protein